MQSQLMLYDATLAANTLHGRIVDNEQNLKEIMAILPTGSEATISLLVGTDLKGSDIKVYDVATVHLYKIGERKLTTATIGSYATGIKCISYTPITANSNHSIVPMAEGEKVNFLRDQKDFNQLQNRCPEAFSIVSFMQRVLNQGVLLPSDKSIHYCIFQVMVRTQINTQVIYFSHGVRGTEDPNNIKGKWESVWSLRNLGDDHFNGQCDVASGKIVSPYVPENAIRINSKTMRALI